MTDDKQKRLVRFDFPPGASFKEIAEALQATRERLRAEKKARDEARTPNQRRHSDDAGTEA